MEVGAYVFWLMDEFNQGPIGDGGTVELVGGGDALGEEPIAQAAKFAHGKAMVGGEGGGVVGVVNQGEGCHGGGGGRSIGPVEVSVSVCGQALVHKL